jgi:hypothetical protein
LGPVALLQVSPGTSAVRTMTVHGLDAAEAPEDPQGTLFELDEISQTRAAITAWSPGSRRRMVRTIAELDYSGWARDGGDLAMVTLTLPGWWEIVAPDGRRFKQLLDTFRKRWTREVGIPWRGLWKLEFQRRGAPHLHALMRVPALVGQLEFEWWLSLTWAEICADSLAPRDRAAYVQLGEADRHVLAGTGVDFGEAVRYSDPRRTSIYFLKHSTKTEDSKEYQHIVPELWSAPDCGPGRFWGYWGLRRAVVEVELPWGNFVRARRILRHVARGQAAAIALSRLRAGDDRTSTDLRAGRPLAGVMQMKRPKVRSLGARGGGWVLVNDGVSFAYDLARALQLPQP